jgi:hypothetical protein
MSSPPVHEREKKKKKQYRLRFGKEGPDGLREFRRASRELLATERPEKKRKRAGGGS